MNKFVYLDNNATTKISSEIKEKLLPYLDLQFGNPSSIYSHGQKVKQELNEARENCAKLIGCSFQNIIFTSGGTESNCSAFNSAVNQYPNKKKIITTKVEHSSILEYCKLLEKKGYQIVYLDVDQNCNLVIEQIEKEVDENTCILSIQLVNNEVGTILLTEEIIKKIKQLKNKFDFVFHTDAVQGLGKIVINAQSLGADMVSFSGHKIHCPKGIGILYIKDTKNYFPLITGHQEFGLRGGTENVLGIIAMGESCKHINLKMDEYVNTISKTNQYLESKLVEIKGVALNCAEVLKISNTTSITFDDFDGNQMLLKLDNYGICVSTGSACNSESSKPSHVLINMGIKNPQNTIRVSIDENTSISQIDYFIEKLNLILKEK